jgi:ankyrin repeat protein
LDLAVNVSIPRWVCVSEPLRIAVLLERGASPCAINEFGKAPLDIAKTYQRDDIVKLLPDGADTGAALDV